MTQNESLGCGCKVYQKKLGSTPWNRIDMCNVHFAAKELLDALKDAVQGCPCSVRERDSGHRVDCYAPRAIAVIQKAETAS